MDSNNTWRENDVIRALQQLQPRPSERFYRRIQSAPWMAEPHRSQASRLNYRVPNRFWMRAAAILVVLLAMRVALTTPPLRALAQELLDLFTRDSSDVVTKQQLEADSNNVAEVIYPLSRAEAEDVAGFDVWVPSKLPDGYRLDQFGYMQDKHAVISGYRYLAAPASGFRFSQPPMFVLVQQPATHAGNSLTFRVGASADVETVSIGNTTGEYVEGVWTAGSSESEQLRWRWLPGNRTLRWQRGDFVFTLDVSSLPHEPGFLGREELIALAEQVTSEAEE